jgi:transposase
MAKGTQFSPEVRERAVRLVHEHCDAHDSQWAAIRSVAEKIGCSAEALRKWVRQSERDVGARPGPSTEEQARVKALEREVKELRRANEILRKASAYFAQAELDRRGT